MGIGSLRRVLALVALVLVPLAAHATLPAVPSKLGYQGVLLDAGGTPRSGPVDLTLRIYDAASGGSLVYKQVFLGVPLTDGVFSVNLGPNGSATDTPANPLTTTLAGAFATDAGASGIDRFLEITVGAEGALARTQILTAPFALRAATADSVATTGTVGGVPAAFVEQLYQYGNADDQGPPNADPREGVADVDGDGLANLIDADNDNDGILDGSEIALGRDMNLVTPNGVAFTPPSAFALGASTITVTGVGFLPGLSVSLGTQSPAPSGLSATSFQIVVGPQTAGAKAVVITNPNGEANTGTPTFTFNLGPLAHAVPADAGVQLRLDARSDLRLALSGAGAYGATPSSQAGAPSVAGSFASEGADGQIAVGFDGSGRLVGLRCRNTATDTCNVELTTDLDGDLQLEAGEVTTVLEGGLTGSGASAPRLYSPDLVRDAAGRLVLGYVVRSGAGTQVVVAYDRNADGDFADANEKVQVSAPSAVPSPASGSVAVDAAGRVALAWVETSGANALTKLAFDRNADGDFADANEQVLLKTSGVSAPPSVGVAFDPANRVAVIFNDPSFLIVRRDLNDDGDFFDAGEDDLRGFVSSVNSVDAAGSAGTGGLALSYIGTTGLRLLLDRNNDGDFADANEDQLLSATVPISGAPRSAVTRTAAGVTFVALAGTGGGQIFVDEGP